MGEIHAQIAKTLGSVAYATTGTIRDLRLVEDADFQCFAAGASVSHSYAHIIDYGSR